MRAFLDTNVLLYADDADAGPKTAAARTLVRRCMEDRTGVVSTQVLQEYYVNATKKLRMEGSEARARIELYLGFEVVTTSTSLLLAAVDLHRLERVSFWDAMVIRAAQHAGCITLFSEDLQAGRHFGATQVLNPFA